MQELPFCPTNSKQLKEREPLWDDVIFSIFHFGSHAILELLVIRFYKQHRLLICKRTQSEWNKSNTAGTASHSTSPLKAGEKWCVKWPVRWMEAGWVAVQRAAPRASAERTGEQDWVEPYWGHPLVQAWPICSQSPGQTAAITMLDGTAGKREEKAQR